MRGAVVLTILLLGWLIAGPPAPRPRPGRVVSRIAPTAPPKWTRPEMKVAARLLGSPPLTSRMKAMVLTSTHSRWPVHFASSAGPMPGPASCSSPITGSRGPLLGKNAPAAVMLLIVRSSRSPQIRTSSRAELDALGAPPKMTLGLLTYQKGGTSLALRRPTEVLIEARCSHRSARSAGSGRDGSVRERCSEHPRPGLRSRSPPSSTPSGCRPWPPNCAEGTVTLKKKLQ